MPAAPQGAAGILRNALISSQRIASICRQVLRGGALPLRSFRVRQSPRTRPLLLSARPPPRASHDADHAPGRSRFKGRWPSASARGRPPRLLARFRARLNPVAILRHRARNQAGLGHRRRPSCPRSLRQSATSTLRSPASSLPPLRPIPARPSCPGAGPASRSSCRRMP